MERKAKPFFKPESKSLEDMEKYFNIENDKEAMQDTYIGRADRELIKKNQDAFADFDTKKK